ncbi:MAG TPA: hypothetical protein DDZ68_01420 [Parvularcula sp.]|nr:hypothetical protein [Parvularcula sp.]
MKLTFRRFDLYKMRFAWIVALAFFVSCAEGPKSPISSTGDAGKFIEEAEKRYLTVSLKQGRASWVQSNFITVDTEAIAAAAKERRTAVVLFVDELQYVPEKELATLVSALHRVDQRQLPFALVAAGLPQLLGRLGEAKSYAERLFEFIPLDRLEPAAARDAIVKPAEEAGVRFEPAAVDLIIRETQGYPYFLQEWGKYCWDFADASPVTLADARRASVAALAELDASFFRVRFDRLTALEKNYLRAMAELGPGPHRSGDIADLLGRKVTALGPVRNSLIVKGMIFSMAHGESAFTVPLFDAFMRRVMPAIAG